MTPSQQTWLPLRYPDGIILTSRPLDHEPEFARLLGVLLERWSFVESELAVSMAHLLDGNFPAAKAITYSLNATTVRITLVRSVAREVMPEGPEKRGLIYLLDKLRKLADQRNEYVHAEYHLGSAEGEIGRRQIRPSTADPDRWDSVTVKKLAEHIDQCERRLLALELINAEDTARWTPHYAWRDRR